MKSVYLILNSTTYEGDKVVKIFQSKIKAKDELRKISKFLKSPIRVTTREVNRVDCNLDWDQRAEFEKKFGFNPSDEIIYQERKTED